MLRRDCKVLLVDDDEDTLTVLQHIFERKGFTRLTFAEDGMAALHKIENLPPDIVVCDWNMPKLSGLELLKTIRGNPGYAGIAFLMLTAEKQKEEVVTAIKEGVNDYLVKPFDESALMAKIDILIEGHTLGILKG